MCQPEPIRSRSSLSWEGPFGRSPCPPYTVFESYPPSKWTVIHRPHFYRQASAPFRAVYKYPAGQPKSRLTLLFYFLFFLINYYYLELINDRRPAWPEIAQTSRWPVRRLTVQRVRYLGGTYRLHVQTHLLSLPPSHPAFI